MRRSKFKTILTLLLILSVVLVSCKKDEETVDDTPTSTNTTKKGTIKMGISDAKKSHSTKVLKEGIINSSELTKCELTISSIELKNSDGDYINILNNPTNVDLRVFQGTVSELLNTSIELGTYTGVRVTISGVSTTYEGNNYTASSSSMATVTIQNPAMTIDETGGVTNAFETGDIIFELPVNFQIASTSDVENIRLFFDAEASTYVVSYSYQTYTWNFASIRDNMGVSIILEEGIQQIRHSPPMGITIVGANDVNYYGVHTFIDFNGKGGTINSHTSQHVFRGIDGSLLVDAEPMIVNTNVLSPNSVSATGESDIRADETFKYTDIINKLNADGYTFVSGETYYFSLRKTWNITTDGQTYDLTRICEPIPVVIP